MNKITYNDKVALSLNPDIPTENKVTDENMNEIKNVINSNADINENTIARVDDLEKNNVIFETTLTDEINEIIVPGLDIVRDGGIYDITLIVAGTDNSDIGYTVGNTSFIETGYSSFCQYTTGTNIADGGSSTFNGENVYRTNKGYWYAGLAKGIITMGINEISLALQNGLISSKWSTNIAYDGFQYQSNSSGGIAGNHTNIKLLKFKANSGNFKVGSRIIVKKRV